MAGFKEGFADEQKEEKGGKEERATFKKKTEK